MNERDGSTLLQVTYMELLKPPAPICPPGPEHIARERLTISEYLRLYRAVGESVRWTQRLEMPQHELRSLLESERVVLYVLRDSTQEALGFTEFDHTAFPVVELKNFGLVPKARGRGLGPWLLSVALQEEWKKGATRVWLHTDTWDHPAAVRVYERAGFDIYTVRTEPAGPL